MSHLTLRIGQMVMRRFDLSGGETYSYAPCCGTNRFTYKSVEMAVQQKYLRSRRFDLRRFDGLGFAVCPEKWKRFYEAVRIRTLRTQQRAISQCH